MSVRPSINAEHLHHIYEMSKHWVSLENCGLRSDTQKTLFITLQGMDGPSTGVLLNTILYVYTTKLASTLQNWPWCHDGKNCCFMPHFKALPLELGTVPGLLTLDLCSARPELPTNQERKPRLLLSWNGEALKSAKIIHILHEVPPPLLSNLVTFNIMLCGFSELVTVYGRVFVTGGRQKVDWWERRGEFMSSHELR